MEIRLPQSVSWAKYTGADARDQKTYANPVSVQARVLMKVKDIIGQDGEVTTTMYIVMLGAVNQPSIEDLFDGRQTIAVDQQLTVDGQTVGWIAYTR